MTNLQLSWNERFALIDRYSPTDEQVCAVFGLSADELATARDLRAAGTFSSSPNFDATPYAEVFTSVVVPATTITTRVGTAPTSVAVPTATPKADVEKINIPTTAPKATAATTHARPETASRRVKEPQKRGRKGDKITRALTAVPTTPVPVESFIAEHGVSLAVLRQSKRFIAAMDAATASTIGKVNVRQDRATHQLMIWRELEEV